VIESVSAPRRVGPDPGHEPTDRNLVGISDRRGRFGRIEGPGQVVLKLHAGIVTEGGQGGEIVVIVIVDTSPVGPAVRRGRAVPEF